MSVLTISRPGLASRWRSFEAWVGTRSSAAALFVLALAVFALQSAFLPAYPGRDMTRYIQMFVQLRYHVPVYPAVINTRGPLAALGVGLPLEIGGWAAEVLLGLLFACSIVAWGRVALTFGARAAVVTSGLLLLYPGYEILFHELASDALFAAAFAGWSMLLTRAALRPSVKAFLLLGSGMGVLVLVRPGNQVLIVMALLPLLLRAPWRDRLAWVAAVFVASVGVTQGWKALATLRYGDAVALKPSAAGLAAAAVLSPLLFRFRWGRRTALVAGLVVVAVVAMVMARDWPGQSPAQDARLAAQTASNQFLYRSFELDRIMSPKNGPASRRAARIVQRDLLTREPYRSYGVDVNEFFSSGSDRVFGDLTGVVPAADLAAATREAVRRHPVTFTTSILRTLWDELARGRIYAPVPLAEKSQGAVRAQETQYIVVKGRRLPRPTEGQPIPSSAIGPVIWAPGGPAREVWRSPTDHGFVFADARDQRRFEKFGREVNRLAARVPTRDGNQELVRRLNQASHVFPPIIVWLVIGLVALTVRRPRHALAALAPSIAGLLVIVATALVAPSVPQYAMPVAPAFLLLASAGLVGLPADGMRSLGRLRVSARVGGYAGAVAAVTAAAWAAQAYVSHVNDALSADKAPHDLGVFLDAAGRVLHGVSPHVYQADATYAYPPLLALLTTPLHPLSAGVATLVWTIVCLAAIVAALWLLGLRDWRCYALAAVYPMTRSAVDLGTIGPFLLLAVALAWRWRDHTARAGAAVGMSIALKLFLWPLGVWLALTGRARVALAAAGFAILFVLIPWAAIGFDGLASYPGLLRHLADDEASSSYSLVAVGVRLHLPESVATVVSLLVAAGLIGAAALVGRDDKRDRRDRDLITLTLALAAALAASPIVWVHYFLLLLVPLALSRPRLSPLWFLPFAYYPLGETAWPGGDAGKLALALVTTAVVVLGIVFRGSADSRPSEGVRPGVPARRPQFRLTRAR